MAENPVEATEARLAVQATQLPSLRALFAADARRPSTFRREAVGLRLDLCRQRVNAEVMSDLLRLAEARGLPTEMARLAAGERVNVTEHRAAAHMALRAPAGMPMAVEGVDVVPQVQAVLQRMADFAEPLRRGEWRGAGGASITDVVNIGIGGSDLGPRMVCEALQDQADGPRLHFVANVDPAHLLGVLRGLDPRRTLFIITSKTFTTQETLANADLARRWIRAAVAESDLHRHFVAVTTNLEGAAAFGIPAEQCFGFWDWVGGRYSVWSAVGLAVMLALGPSRFAELLAGAHAMDQHFIHAPLGDNLPVLMGLIAYWNTRFLQVASQVVAPYAQRLALFVPWLQQLEMESNGKGVDRQGRPLSQATTPALWGDVGSNSQHAFFQMLHQGPSVHAVDFILPLAPVCGEPAQHRLLLANALAQSAALMLGRDAEAVRQQLQQQGLSGAELAAAVPHRVFPGNRPSTLLMMERLDAQHLGALMALYEHRTYVLSVLWNVHPFDQWGVELGKQIARQVDAALAGGELTGLDPATAAVVADLQPRFTAGS